MRKFTWTLLALMLLAGAGAVAWARCSAMTSYRMSRPEFFFYQALAMEQARQEAKALRKEKTLARISAIASLEEQTRAKNRENRRDSLEDQFQRAYGMSPEQRERIARDLYERGKRAERNNVEAAQDYYLFAMQSAPGTDVSVQAHEALIRLDSKKKAAGGARNPSAGGDDLLSQSDLAEIQRTLAQEGGNDSAEAEKVRQMLEQMTDFGDEKRQRLISERLRDEPGAAYSDGLIQAIRLANGSAKEAARQALVERFGRMDSNTLRNKLAGGEAEGRLAAVKAIGAAKKGELTADLITAVADKEEEVRQAARQTLEGLTGQDFGPSPGASIASRVAAQQRWQRWWKSQPAK